MQGVGVTHMRGSDSTIYAEGQALFISCFSISIFTKFGVKPLMGLCIARLFVQPEYYIIVENDIPRILTHIGPPNSS